MMPLVVDTVQQLRAVRKQLADRNELVDGDEKAKDLVKASKELIDKLNALEEKLHNPKAKVTYDIFGARGGAKLYSQYAFLFDMLKGAENFSKFQFLNRNLVGCNTYFIDMCLGNW